MNVNEDLDQAVFDWLSRSWSKLILISGPILPEQAKIEALKLGINNFVESNGWLHRFKKRWNVSSLKICGEEVAVSPDVVDSWNKRLSILIGEGYSLKDIFNADEAGFFHNLLPNRTLHVKGEACHGGKMSKERFTVLLCAHSDGSEKLT
jgi:hypothetical protein